MINLLNIYRIFLFLFSFFLIIINYTNFYDFFKMLFASLLIIGVITVKSFWIKKKVGFIKYYINIFIFFIMNIIYLSFLIMTLF